MPNTVAESQLKPFGSGASPAVKAKETQGLTKVTSFTDSPSADRQTAANQTSLGVDPNTEVRPNNAEVLDVGTAGESIDEDGNSQL